MSDETAPVVRYALGSMAPRRRSTRAKRPTDAAVDAARDARLRESEDRFVAIWGHMATKWGIPRTMAEVHALLYITGQPLHAEDVMERLGISRGNASMSLRALVDWGIVDRVHPRGERKEHFVAEQDVWRMIRTIARERKQREIDPLLDALGACRDITTPDAGDPEVRAHQTRLEDMLEVMQLIERLSRRFVGPTGKGLQLAAKLLARAS